MRVTKYIHSCLLIEDQGKTILIDPGIFTYEAKALDVNILNKLDYILVTHGHTDHVSVLFLKELLKRFPKVKIISNRDVVNLLRKEGIAVQTNSNEHVQLTPAEHERLIPGMQMPENTLFTVFGRLNDPGDSLHFDKSSEILALPVQAPWGSLVQAVEKALILKPKIIIPIHDWHWRDEARIWAYGMMEKVFDKEGIEFKRMETGVSVEV